jgi:hypothetical protein
MGHAEDLFDAAMDQLEAERRSRSNGAGDRSKDDHEPAGRRSAERTQAATLVDLTLAAYNLCSGPDGEPLAVQDGGPNLALPLRGRGGLRQALAALYRANHGRPPGANALADALLVLEGIAQGAPRRDVHLRVADHAGGVVVDLGDTEGGRAVIVSGGAWRIAERSPVLFRRTSLVGPMPTPVRGGRLERLAELVNVPDGSWPLLVSWLLACWLPSQPAPLLLLAGEQGTGKSTAARLFVETVDPGPAPLRTAPRDVESWVTAAAASRVVALDNLSGVPAWLSDALCRAVTGDGLVRRALYTDSDVSVLNFRRAVLLTAIDAGALRGDLADRLLTVDLERIDDAHRRTDAGLGRAWSDARPEVVGGLLDLLAEVLVVLPGVHLDRLPRMADFARLVAAVDTVLGTDGLAAYLGQRFTLAETVVEGDPVAAAMRSIATARRRWEGTAGELLEVVTDEAHGDRKPPRWWPGTPRAMAGAARRAAPALRQLGVEVDFVRSTDSARARLVRLTARKTPPEEPSESSEPSDQLADLGKRSDGTPDGSDGYGPTVRPTVRGSQGPDQGQRNGSDGSDDSDGRAGAISCVRCGIPTDRPIRHYQTGDEWCPRCCQEVAS